MADLRKLAEQMAALSKEEKQAKPIVEGSMIKSLSMLVKADAPKHKLAEEFEQFKEARVPQLPTRGADYSGYDTEHLKTMLRPGIMHRDENKFKTLIRRELKKREAAPMQHTVNALQNPPKVMQHRARRDQERDAHWMSTQLAKNESAAEGTVTEAAGYDVIRALISEFNTQMSGSPYYPMDYKSPGMRMWTRGDGSKYKDPGYVFIDRDLKPEDIPKWKNANAIEKFWQFLAQKGARKIGDVSGEFGSDPHSPAVVLGKLIFVYNRHGIAWGSTSRLKNSSVWRQKKVEGAMDETIVKTGGEYELKSHTGKNLGTYPTKAGAEKREKQVNYFKHVKEDGTGEPSVDDILYYLTSAYRHLQKNADFYQDFSVITRVYENLRYDLKAGDYAAFQRTYENCLAKYPDASVELIDAMFVEAGLPEEQGTIEQFIEKCSGMNEVSNNTLKSYADKAGKEQTGYMNAAKAQHKAGYRDKSHEYFTKSEKRGAGVQKALSKIDKNVTQEATGDTQRVTKGAKVETPKGPGVVALMFPDNTVEVNLNSGGMAKFYLEDLTEYQGVTEAGYEETEETSVINMFEKLVKQGRDPIDMIAHKFGWGSYELDQLAKNLGFRNSAAWAQGVMQGKGVNGGVEEGIGDTIKRGVKSVKRGMQGWGQLNDIPDDDPRLLPGAKDTPRQLVARNKGYDDATVKQLARPVKSSFPFGGDDTTSPHSPRGLQKRVLDREMRKRGLTSESYGVFSRFDESAPIKTFALKEDAMAMAKRYNKINPQEGVKYVVRNVQEAMNPAVATAQTKMNPGAATSTPTSAPTSPATSSAPVAPGSQGVKTPAQVDPAVAKAEQQAYQKNVAKLGVKGINTAQTGVSMQKQADDMQLTPTDNTNNAKIAGTLSNVLKDPAGAQQLKTLTDKYNKKPGQV